MNDATKNKLATAFQSRVTRAAAFGFFAFVALYSSIPTQHLIILLNSMFFGAMVGFVVTFIRIIYDAFFGVGPYDRVRQMTIGIIIGWAAIACFVGNSITLRVTDPGISPNTLVRAGAGYLAIWSAIMEVTAPDFGQSFFYGRDRRLLWLGIGVGLVVAIVLVVLQAGDITAGK